jgi:hypothetical protein
VNGGVAARDRPRTAIALVATAVLTFSVPSAVFVLVAVAKGMSLPEASGALVEQFTAERHNLRGVSLLSLLPCVLLAVLVGVRWRFTRTERRPLYAVSGAVPILLVTAFVNYEFWSRYLPSRAFLGFPHGMELVIGPLFFAPIGVVIALAVAWSVLRIRS